MDKLVKYVISRLDDTTAWIGLIGLTLLLLNLHSALIGLFILLFFLPSGNFSDLFKTWTKGVRSVAHDDRPTRPRY